MNRNAKRAKISRAYIRLAMGHFNPKRGSRPHGQEFNNGEIRRTALKENRGDFDVGRRRVGIDHEVGEVCYCSRYSGIRIGQNRQQPVGNAAFSPRQLSTVNLLVLFLLGRSHLGPGEFPKHCGVWKPKFPYDPH